MRYLFIVLLAGFSCPVQAQRGLTIKGLVRKQVSRSIMPDATLILKKDNGVIARAISDKTGMFSFSHVLPGKLVLVTNYIGFKTDTQYVDLKRDTAIMINLDSASRQLAEVKVRSFVSPVTMRNDTLSFNTRAYKTRPHATLEELLKMLPGAKIDDSGNVTINGQKVDHITIDGKSYSVSDLRMLTQNIPADMISKVEVFDSRSEENKQAGIVSMSQSKTIDLKLKDDKKNGYTGKAYAAAGNNSGYSAGGSLLGLDPKELFSLRVNANNINNQFTGPDVSSGQGGQGRQDNRSLSFFGGFPISKKLSVTATSIYNYTGTNLQSTTDRQTYLSDSSLLSGNESRNINKNSGWANFAKVAYQINERSTLSYALGYSTSGYSVINRDSTLLNIKKADTGYTGSKGLANNSNQQSSYMLHNSVELAQRFGKKGRSMVVSLNQSLSEQHQQTDIYTSVQAYTPPSLKIVDQRVLSPVKTNNYNANVVFQEPLSNSMKLSGTYMFNDSKNQSLKNANDYDSHTGLYDLHDSLNSSHFISAAISHTFRTSVTNAGESHQITYSLSLGGQSYQQKNDDINAGVHLSHIYYNFQPQAILDIKLKNNKSLKLYYSGSNRNPTLDQLQPVADQSNPYLLKSGNPGLKQSVTHESQVSYACYNTQNGQSLQLNLSGDLTRHQISSATTILAGGVQQIQFVNLDGVYHLNAIASYAFPLIKQENGTGSIEAKINDNHDHNRINGADNIIEGKGITGSFMLNYHKGNAVFIECDGSVQYLANRYSLNQTKSNTLQQDYNVNATYMAPLGISAGMVYSLQLRTSNDLPRQHANVLSTYLAKDIFANKAAQLRLSGINLLDAASAISQTTGQNYIETTRTNRLRRLFLLSFTYNFDKFQKGGH